MLRWCWTIYYRLNGHYCVIFITELLLTFFCCIDKFAFKSNGSVTGVTESLKNKSEICKEISN